MPYLVDKSYLAVKAEANEGEVIKPDKFIPLISESIRSDLALVADRRIKGLDWKSDDLLRGSRGHAGDIVISGDADNLGHFLNMVLKKGTTTGDAINGYIHPFTVDNPKTYTIEIGKGTYAQRYFGVKGDRLRLEFVDGKLQATLSIKAMGQFSVGALAEALAGLVTSLKLNQEYDLNPTSGLVVGDIIQVKQDVGTYVDLTILTIPDGQSVTFVSTTITAAIGNPVRLKLQTPSFTTLQEPLFQGNALVGVGVNETAATTAAGSKATATPIYEFVLEKMNNLLDAPATGSMEPIKLLPQVREGILTISQLFENEIQHLDWLNRIKQAITLIVSGKIIGTGKEKLTWKCHKVKLTSNEEPLDVGSYIFDRQTFEMLYDVTDVKAITVELVNKSAGTVYGG